MRGRVVSLQVGETDVCRWYLIYRPGHAGDERTGREDKLAGKATIMSGLFRKLQNVEELETLPTTCMHKATAIEMDHGHGWG